VTYHSVKSPWGKVIGGFLGFCVGGPWGAAAGLIVGHFHDTKADNGATHHPNLWGSPEGFTGTLEQATFTMGVIVLGAKMAKADGRVTRAEIEAFKKVFQIGPAQEASVARLFDRARLSAEGFEPYALQLAHVYRRKPAVLEEILSGLFIIAAADNAGLSPAEMIFLKRISFIFGFGREDFARIAARAGVRIPEGGPARHKSSHCYAILGIQESATSEEVKMAYRALIREHHPDKLMAEGMPPEFVASATEKMKRINVAYDEICHIKGIK